MANRSSSGGGSGWASPDRTVVWTEPKKKKVASVAVVYYLCRQDGQLEHPHFVHVPCLSDPPRLYLRDVLARLSDLRGAAMPASYSWSAKTTYRNAGYVWHDLTADDLILPAQGNHEYVLKGSPLLLLRPTATDHLQLPAASTKRSHHNRWTSFDLADYNRSGAPAAELIGIDEISPPPCSSSPDSSRQLQQDGTPQSAAAAAGLSRMRASAMLMQLISCGSIKNAVPPRRKGSSSESDVVVQMQIGRGCGDNEGDYFSGSLVEKYTNKSSEYCNAGAGAELRRSSSCNADRGASSSSRMGVDGTSTAARRKALAYAQQRLAN